MKACDDRLIELMDAVEGTPTPELSRHVASCEGCRAELKALRSTEALLRDTAAHPDDFSLSGFAYRVADRAEAFRDRSPRGLWWSLTRAMRITVGFSASALTFAAVLFVSSRHVTPAPVVAPAIQTQTASARVAPKSGQDEIAAEVDQMISADRGEPDISLDSGLAGMSADELDELAQQLDTDQAG